MEDYHIKFIHIYINYRKPVMAGVYRFIILLTIADNKRYSIVLKSNIILELELEKRDKSSIEALSQTE